MTDQQTPEMKKLLEAFDTDTRCENCFEPKQEQPQCPHCGWKKGTPLESGVYLPPGTLLSQKYMIGKMLGHGGFGITYLGWDLNLEIRLAVKEYLPRDMAARTQDRHTIMPYTGAAKDQFEYGLEKFLDEARALAKFEDYPGIVSVRDYFRENGTAYFVMFFVEGVTLKEYLTQKEGRLPFDLALKILMPVFDALKEVHRTGLLHRDISPDNIYITEDGRVKILDFGAARYATGEHSRSLSVILKPGYAPEEQYRSKGKQGPWTDIYSLCATLYRTITGQTPPESLDRMAEESLEPPSALGVEIFPQAEAALLKGLSIRASDRFQSIETLQTEMFRQEDPKPAPDSESESKSEPSSDKSVPKDSEEPNVSSPWTNRPPPVTPDPEIAPKKSSRFPWVAVFVVIFLMMAAGGWVKYGHLITSDSTSVQSPPVAAEPDVIPKLPVEKKEEIKEPPKTPEPKVTYGKLKISSVPSGASLYVDNALAGNTPYEADGIVQGTYHITLEKNCYGVKEEEVIVAPGKLSERTLFLEKICGRLHLESNPSGAVVYVDRQNMGQTPLNLENLPQGSKTIRFEKSGYTSQQTRVMVQPGEESRWSVRLIKKLSHGDRYRNDLGMEFVYIAPGKFWMGSPPDEPKRDDDDEIRHEVELTKGYYIQTTEVTQGQWKAIMGSNPSYFKDCGSDCPVENVSWNDIQEYVKALMKQDNQDYRLPTEAEWEYAARAGTNTAFAFGDCLSTSQANYDGDYPMPGCSKGTDRKRTVTVGSFSPNAWGLYDMHGNVWEWCQDWYGKYANVGNGSVRDPIGPSIGSDRVLRGGSWYGDAGYCRSADRNGDAPDYRRRHGGFRLGFSPRSAGR